MTAWVRGSVGSAGRIAPWISSGLLARSGAATSTGTASAVYADAPPEPGAVATGAWK
ncbi:hypothetical protein ACGFY6_33465 [Streptomyces sp. NPDC048387]|uniref:hypothetical protein n=1 Tax=unclassified Streptomyces TaxID=2593676 RepID=UPI0033A9FB55